MPPPRVLRAHPLLTSTTHPTPTHTSSTSRDHSLKGWEGPAERPGFRPEKIEKIPFRRKTNAPRVGFKSRAARRAVSLSAAALASFRPAPGGRVVALRHDPLNAARFLHTAFL